MKIIEALAAIIIGVIVLFGAMALAIESLVFYWYLWLIAAVAVIAAIKVIRWAKPLFMRNRKTILELSVVGVLTLLTASTGLGLLFPIAYAIYKRQQEKLITRTTLRGVESLSLFSR